MNYVVLYKMLNLLLIWRMFSIIALFALVLLRSTQAESHLTSFARLGPREYCNLICKMDQLTHFVGEGTLKSSGMCVSKDTNQEVAQIVLATHRPH